MERRLIAVVFVVVVVEVIGSILVVHGCSPPEDGSPPKSDSEKILDAKDVLYGQVRKVYPDQRFDYGDGTTAYTAEMDVFCNLKGPATEQIVNITEAGIIPGLCHSTNLTVGGRYILIVHRDEETGKHSPMSVQIDASTPAALESVLTVCGLVPVYPNGVEASTASVKCPTPLLPGRCKSKSDFDEKSVHSSNNSAKSGAQAVTMMFNVPVLMSITTVTAVVLKLAAFNQ